MRSIEAGRQKDRQIFRTTNVQTYIYSKDTNPNQIIFFFDEDKF
jgi:hypothetical protein